jgi:valyl-tRNA synthetase
MFGDVAIAVHPDHSIYSKFIGKNVINPLNGNVLPVIKDSRVKLDFGTGNI